MGKHRKEAVGSRQSEAAADAAKRLELHRGGAARRTAVGVLDAPEEAPDAAPAAARDIAASVAEPTAASGRHCFGESDTGTAVSGLSSSGVGVAGISSSGPGLSGYSSTGTGVVAASASGNALAVHGKAHFSRSGSALVPKGAKMRTVTVVGATPASLVLVTLQSVRSGVSVLGAVPEHGTFTVHLNKKAPRDTKFAWFVLN
jgi:hypothetical protein